MSSTIPADRVLILDFGSQFTQLIARRVRESGIYCEILPADVAPDRIAAFGAGAYILSGGPASVTDAAGPRVAARRYQYTASASSFGTPRPSACARPRLFCAAGSPCPAALRNQYIASD